MVVRVWWDACSLVCCVAFLKRHRLTGGKPQLRLGMLLTALHVAGETDVDKDELECIVANLIFHRSIKGYVAHAQQILVLSKVDPFPKLAAVQ